MGGSADLSHSVKLTGFHVLDISFVDTKHGFALGAFDQPHMAVLRTSDGGRTWKTVTTPPEAVAHVEFATPRLGWVYGPHLYVTRDGGGTWTQQDPGGRVRALRTSGPSLWALTGACRREPCALTLRVSDDAGRSWRTGTLTAGLTDDHWDIARVGRTGWIEGSRAGGGLHDALARTDDGGRTWVSLDDPCDRWFTIFGHRFRPVFETHLAPVDARRLWLLCTTEPAGGVSYAVLMTSGDAGATWTKAWEHPSSNQLHVAATSTTNGWQTDASSAYELRRISTDGTYDPHAIQPRPDYGWSDLQFVGSRYGWASAGPDVYRTDDGGRRWEAVRLKPTGCG